MESKAGPSCRLVFCLLISAAVLRPGEQGPPGSPRPTWAGGNFLRSGPGPRTSGAVRAGVWGGRYGDGGAGTGLALGSVTCAARVGPAGWLKFGQGLGALGKSPGTLGAAGIGASGPRGQDSSGSLSFPLRLPPRRRALAP